MRRIENLRIVRDLLLLADVEVPLLRMVEWRPDVVKAAEKWAVSIHLAASDNRVRIPAMPKELKAYRRAE